MIELYQLLDATYTSMPNEYIVMNGATPVSTVGTYIRQTRAHSHGGTNAGAITCRQKTTTANIMMVLPAGYNATMILHIQSQRVARAILLNGMLALRAKQMPTAT